MDNQNELFSALSKAQGKFKTVAASKQVIVKMNSGGSYSYNYATLATIMDMIRLPFSENGLSISQLITEDRLVTILAHSSGQSIESTVQLPKSSDIKQLGANLTYLRRYSITAIAGIAIDEEDDETIAEGKIEQRKQVAITPKEVKTVVQPQAQPTPAPTAMHKSELDEWLSAPPEVVQSKPADKPAKPFKFASTLAENFFKEVEAATGNYYGNGYHFEQAMKKVALTWSFLNDSEKRQQALSVMSDYARQRRAEGN